MSSAADFAWFLGKLTPGLRGLLLTSQLRWSSLRPRFVLLELKIKGDQGPSKVSL